MSKWGGLGIHEVVSYKCLLEKQVKNAMVKLMEGGERESPT